MRPSIKPIHLEILRGVYKSDEIAARTKGMKKICSYSNRVMFAPVLSPQMSFKKLFYFESYNDTLVYMELLEVDLFEFIDMQNGRESPFIYFCKFAKWEKEKQIFTW